VAVQFPDTRCAVKHAAVRLNRRFRGLSRDIPVDVRLIVNCPARRAPPSHAVRATGFRLSSQRCTDALPMRMTRAAGVLFPPVITLDAASPSGIRTEAPQLSHSITAIRGSIRRTKSPLRRECHQSAAVHQSVIRTPMDHCYASRPADCCTGSAGRAAGWVCDDTAKGEGLSANLTLCDRTAAVFEGQHPLRVNAAVGRSLSARDR
jgi:hypothetical protein